MSWHEKKRDMHENSRAVPKPKPDLVSELGTWWDELEFGDSAVRRSLYPQKFVHCTSIWVEDWGEPLSIKHHHSRLRSVLCHSLPAWSGCLASVKRQRLRVTDLIPRMMSTKLVFQIGRACKRNSFRSLSDLPSASLVANNEFILSLLVCPLSKEPLELDPKLNRLISHAATVAFPITKGGCINMTIMDAYVMGSEGPDSSGN